MSKQIQNAVNADRSKQIVELENVKRLIANTQYIIADVQIRGVDAKAVYEVQNWLQAFSSSVTQQLDSMNVIVPEIVEEVKP